MGLMCKCHNCEKDVLKVMEIKKANDGNNYCYKCFYDLGLIKEEASTLNNKWPVISIILKILSLIYLAGSLFTNITYSGSVITENFVITGITISVVLWALAVIVEKLCIIADNISK